MEQAEQVLYDSHPAMFGNRPIWFVVCLLLVPVFGIGLFFLLSWWIGTLGTKLTVTNDQTTLRKGIFSKYTNDCLHESRTHSL